MTVPGVVVRANPQLAVCEISVPKTGATSRGYAWKFDRIRWGQIQQEWYVFAFVRHPLSRFVSYWQRHRKSTGESFEQCAERVLSGAMPPNKHFWPQADILAMSPKSPDYIGRFERMRADWRILMDQFGFRAMPHKNKSRHGPWEGYYSPALRVRVEDYYRADMEAFGY